MNKIFFIFSIFIIIFFPGCKTIEYVYPEYELPPEPEREILQQPETIQDLGLIINYYDSLVSKWERWAASVKEILK